MRAATSLLVVIVDDDDDGREMLRVLLESLGHRVQCARDGQSGLALICGTRPDLAIIDLHLPQMSGYDVVRCVRTAGVESHCAALTGDARAATRAAAIAAGFDTHVLKPLDLRGVQNLLSALRRTDQPAIAHPAQAVSSPAKDSGRSSRPD